MCSFILLWKFLRCTFCAHSWFYLEHVLQSMFAVTPWNNHSWRVRYRELDVSVSMLCLSAEDNQRFGVTANLLSFSTMETFKGTVSLQSTGQGIRNISDLFLLKCHQSYNFQMTFIINAVLGIQVPDRNCYYLVPFFGSNLTRINDFWKFWLNIILSHTNGRIVVLTCVWGMGMLQILFNIETGN